MANHNPDWKTPPNPENIFFGSLLFDQNGVARSSGITDVVSLERKDEKDGFLNESDQVCSVSETPVPPLAGEYSGQGNLMEDEKKNSDCEKFNGLVPFDLNSLRTEEAPVKNIYSGEADKIFTGFEKDIYLSNIWSTQGASSYYPFGDHTLYNNASGFSTGHIDEALRGLSVRDLNTSSNVLDLASSPMVNSSVGAGHAISKYARYGHLNDQVGHYAMLSGLSLGCSSSAGLFGEKVTHLNSQAYTPLVSPMMNGLTLGGSSSSINGLNDLETKFNKRRYIDIKKTFLKLIMTREGANYLIDLIANGDRKNTATILEAVATYLFTVIGEEYGLKVFINLLKYCDHTQKEFLLGRIVSDPIGVILRAQDLYGSKALIELVNHLKWSGLIHQIPTILSTEIKPLLLDRFASILIQHCIFVLEPNQCEHLYEAMAEYACSLALDPHLCSMLYNLVDNVQGFLRTQLLNKLADNSVQLSIHPSGNYVVKHVLDLNDDQITGKITYLLRGSYKRLAVNKHGSHVVERCIESVGMQFVLDEFLNMLPAELEEIACHHFGNYVIRKALLTTEKCNLSYHRELVKALRPGLARLEKSPHGKVVYKLLKEEARSKNGRGKKQARR